LLTLLVTAQKPLQNKGNNTILINSITNNGLISINTTIIFTIACTGKNTRALLCRDGVTCNIITRPRDLLCVSTISNETNKSCNYTTAHLGKGLHNNDVATCCNAAGRCDSSTILIEPWTVNTLPTGDTAFESDTSPLHKSAEASKANKITPRNSAVIATLFSSSTATNKSFSLSMIFFAIATSLFALSVKLAPI